MARTPDAADGPLFEEAVIWEEQATDPTDDRRTQLVQDKGLVTLIDGAVRPIGETREAAWQTQVDQINVSTPPGSPTAGYRVIVSDTPTGAFVGHEGEIAQYDGTSWVFTVPKRGTMVYAKDQNEPYKQTALSTPWAWTPSGSGITANEHAGLRQLIHLADGVGGPFETFTSLAYREVLPAADPFPTSVIWWESSSKLKKIVEKTVTRNPNQTPATIEWKVYDTDGSTVLATVTDTMAYSGVFETSRTRTIA